MYQFTSLVCMNFLARKLWSWLPSMFRYRCEEIMPLEGGSWLKLRLKSRLKFSKNNFFHISYRIFSEFANFNRSWKWIQVSQEAYFHFFGNNPLYFLLPVKQPPILPSSCWTTTFTFFFLLNNHLYFLLPVEQPPILPSSC